MPAAVRHGDLKAEQSISLSRDALFLHTSLDVRIYQGHSTSDGEKKLYFCWSGSLDTCRSVPTRQEMMNKNTVNLHFLDPHMHINLVRT